VMARYFGVFGNCVVVDHGYGLMSLSAHLSTIAVKEGDKVNRGQELGRTGATGLAGGDHLHFTMVLHGLPVTPIEWWDGHWIKDRLKLKLGDALPWKPANAGLFSKLDGSLAALAPSSIRAEGCCSPPPGAAARIGRRTSRKRRWR
jgi:murein DD-endopeptidase MepM/ murein hydrolase activator NlpD